ncbi:hypothetical protein quinque_016425 [Culex quinquefasciatus]
MRPVVILAGIFSVFCLLQTCHGAAEGVKYASKDLLVKQKFFFEILRNIYQPLEFEEYLPYTKSWVEDETKYTDYAKVSEFFALFKTGFLPKGEIYTIFNYWYMKQTQLLFDFFYYSADWATLYKNVVWARENTNEGMFMYAVTLVVLHRKDLQGVGLPVVYELNPYLFFNGDLIHDAMVKRMYDSEYGFHSVGKLNRAVSNFTSKFSTNYYGEGKMAYFTEDIGMNAYYFYYMMEYINFLGGEEFGLKYDRRGELFLYMHQQLMARYNLERQSNSMDFVEVLQWNFPLKTGYNPMLRYWNGVPMRSRESEFTLKGYDPMKLQTMLEIEQRFKRVIDLGYYTLSNGTIVSFRAPEAVDFLGNMMGGNADSIDRDYFKAYGVFARMILAQGDYYGFTSDLWPGAVMQMETSMRDPIYYQFVERALDLYWRFKSYLPPYTNDELNFPGVEIKEFSSDKLITYFEQFDADISNGLPFNYKNSQQKSTWDFRVFANKKRINHKPFNYTLTVTSETSGKGVVRMYMGPKFTNIKQLTLLKKYFVEMDQYMVDLVAGENLIKRSTRDFYYNIRDRTTYTELYKRTMRAINDEEPLLLDLSEAHCGWPDRLLLPKGLPNGYELTFYFVISPFRAPKVAQYSTYDATISCGAGSGSKYTDDLPFGFPFDRDLDVGSFVTKNMLFKDVLIYHFDHMGN